MRIMWLPITYQWALKKCNYREFWCAVVYTQTSFSRVFNDNLTLLWLYNHHELVKSFQFYHRCRQVKGKLVECFTKKKTWNEVSNFVNETILLSLLLFSTKKTLKPPAKSCRTKIYCKSLSWNLCRFSSERKMKTVKHRTGATI